MIKIKYNNLRYRAILETPVCKQISFNLFRNEIIYKLFTYRSCTCIHLSVSRQMTDVQLNCLCYVAILETISLCADKWKFTKLFA